RGSSGRSSGQARGTVPTVASVADADEVKTPRGRGRAGLRSIAALERARQHRSDERADHVPEKAVGRQLELECIAAAMPDGAFDPARKDPVLRLGRREGPEIVLAE